MVDILVSTTWLNKNLTNDNLIILDASPLSTATGKKSTFSNKIIPFARFFNIKDDFSDTNSEFPNTFPSVKQFEEKCIKLGINNTSHIVVYDNLGIYTSPRVWWMFKTFGHKNVSVVNGGLPEWIKNGLTTNQKNRKKTYLKGDFKANFRAGNIKFYNDIIANITTKEYLLIDARSKGRFTGKEKEPRKHLQSGSITNAINIPFKDVLQNGKYKSKTELLNLFNTKKIAHKNLIFSCGSGITACIVYLASELILKNNKSIYDGSWAEWAEKQKLFK